MHSKVTCEEDAKAKEKRDLTADMDDAARSSKDRKAKDKPLEPTPRKGEQSKQGGKDDNSGQKDQDEMEVEPETEIANPGSMPVSAEMLGKVQQVLNDQVQELRNELREARVIAVEQKQTIDKKKKRSKISRGSQTPTRSQRERMKKEETQRCTTSWACPRQPHDKRKKPSSTTS